MNKINLKGGTIEPDDLLSNIKEISFHFLTNQLTPFKTDKEPFYKLSIETGAIPQEIINLVNNDEYDINLTAQKSYEIDPTPKTIFLKKKRLYELSNSSNQMVEFIYKSKNVDTHRDKIKIEYKNACKYLKEMITEKFKENNADVLFGLTSYESVYYIHKEKEIMLLSRNWLDKKKLEIKPGNTFINYLYFKPICVMRIPYIKIIDVLSYILKDVPQANFEKIKSIGEKLFKIIQKSVFLSFETSKYFKYWCILVVYYFSRYQKYKSLDETKKKKKILRMYVNL